MAQHTPSASVIFGWGKVSEETAVLLAAAPELLKKGNRVIAAWLNAEPGSTIAAISAELGNLREAIAKAETI